MKKRILIAEDNEEVQNALRNILGTKYDLTIVSTPEDAINYNEPYDLLLTDFSFYNKEGRKIKTQGLDIIEKLREGRKGLAAILMSSDLNPGMVRACDEMNAGTFRKYEDSQTPVEEEGLKRVIAEYIQKYNINSD